MGWWYVLEYRACNRKEIPSLVVAMEADDVGEQLCKMKAIPESQAGSTPQIISKVTRFHNS